MYNTHYPVLLTAQEEGGLLVEFPDLGGFTQGEDEEESLLNAIDLLETLIAFKIKDNEDIPQPSEQQGLPRIAVPPVAAAKLLVYWEMKRQKIRKSTLAKRLNWHGPQIDRLLDVKHESKFSQIQTVLAALGKTMVVDIEDNLAKQ